mgnify:CR=1 FL=1
MGMAGMHHATLLHTSDTGNGTVEAYNPCDGECTWGMQSFLIGLSVLMTVIGHLLPYVHAYSCTEPVWTERVRILCFWFISAPVLMLQNIVAIPVGWTSSSDQLGHYVFGALASFYSSGQLYFMFAKNQETDGSGQPLPESVLSLRRRQVSCKRDAGCCDRWLIALHDPTLYMDVFVMILGGLFGQTHVYEIYNFTGEYGLDKDWKVWRYNHEMFHLIMLEIVLLMGVLSLLISRYELLYKHVSDHGFSTSMLIFGIVFFKHSQEGEGYQKEVHDFWCLLMLVTSALRVLVGRGSKLRAQMAWCYMWASWVFMIAALEERVGYTWKLEASNACSLMAVVAALLLAYVAWSGYRIRRLLDDGTIEYSSVPEPHRNGETDAGADGKGLKSRITAFEMEPENTKFEI